jgi:hypothetical protein
VIDEEDSGEEATQEAPAPKLDGVSIGGKPAHPAPPSTMTAEEFAGTLPRKTGAAGFLAWARSQNLGRRTLEEWKAAYETHLKRPVR